MKLSDLKGVLNKSLVTVESIENPYEDYYMIKLKTEKNFKWQPGEHGIFKLPGKTVEGKKWRAFSVASVPGEGYILLGTRTGKKASGFKKVLLSMKQGESVQMNGPFGWFKVQDNTSPMVLFASGVGITPIRALLKANENNSSRNIEVVYASSDFYLFGEEIESLASQNDKIILHKTNSTEETQSLLKKLAKKYGSGAYYYNSGAPKVIKSTKKVLKEAGISSKRMIDDPFMGY